MGLKAKDDEMLSFQRMKQLNLLLIILTSAVLASQNTTNEPMTSATATTATKEPTESEVYNAMENAYAEQLNTDKPKTEDSENSVKTVENKSQSDSANPPQKKTFAAVSKTAASVGNGLSRFAGEVLREANPILKDKLVYDLTRGGAYQRQNGYNGYGRGGYGRGGYNSQYYGASGGYPMGYHNNMISAGYHKDMNNAGYHNNMNNAGYHNDMISAGYHNNINSAGYHSNINSTGYHNNIYSPVNAVANTNTYPQANYPVKNSNLVATTTPAANAMSVIAPSPAWNQSTCDQTPPSAPSNIFSMLYKMFFGPSDSGTRDNLNVDVRGDQSRMTQCPMSQASQQQSQVECPLSQANQQPQSQPPPVQQMQPPAQSGQLQPRGLSFAEQLQDRRMQFGYPDILTEPLPPPIGLSNGRTVAL